MRLRTAKTLFWFLAGMGLTVILMRIIHGPGAVVALTDIIPWGLWKGGGVVALVPIGGAGFTLAAFVYVFHWERYRPLANAAVLLGLLCYSSVAIGLTFDIGIWWRIVFPVAFWQPHSTLFEVAWCIMLYLGVLVAEFSHVVLKKLNFPRIEALLHKFAIVFVIAGISLSTLHQSSLGTLFLATPYRLHALWYTDLLPLFFFVTAVGLGCLTISWLALFTHWLFRATPPMKAISGLGRISAIVLGVYFLAKLGEVVASGEASLLTQLSWDTANFWLELLLSAALPSILLAQKRFRESPTSMFWISTMAIVGVSLNRVNVAGLASVSTTGELYLPAWMEWTVTIGILSIAALVLLTLVEKFGVFESIGAEEVARANDTGKADHANWKTLFFANPFAETRIYSASFVLSVGLAFGLLPQESIFGLQPEKTATVAPVVTSASNSSRVLKIDGDGNGEGVLFDHDFHVRQNEGDGVCATCHHMAKPGEEVTSCAECHADVHLRSDIFDHSRHQRETGGNKGCAKCHVDPAKEKTRANTTDCASCHDDMRRANTVLELKQGSRNTMAAGYVDAMHGLCMTCHEEPSDGSSYCATCHPGKNPSTKKAAN